MQIQVGMMDVLMLNTIAKEYTIVDEISINQKRKVCSLYDKIREDDCDNNASEWPTRLLHTVYI